LAQSHHHYEKRLVIPVVYHFPQAFQFGMMAQAFFIIYAIKELNLSLEASGIMTGLLFITQVAANPILGRISDKWNSSNVLKGGPFVLVWHL
jgi:MFS family permease